MDSCVINNVVVLLGTRNYCCGNAMLGQVLLSEAEQQAVLGFISLLKRSNDQKIKIAENTVVDSIMVTSMNSSWETVESTIANYKRQAKQNEDDIKDKAE